MESQKISVTVKPNLLSSLDENKIRDDQDSKIKKNKKPKKLRSIKLSKSPSLKPSTRRPKTHLINNNNNITVDFSSSVDIETHSSSSQLSQKSAPLLRRTSSKKHKKTVRSLTREVSLRPMRVMSNKVKRNSDTNIEKPTCSSTLREAKFGVSVRAEHGCEVSDSAEKVCPFSYCSLHGHRRANVPPLQRLISIRRRIMRNERTRVAKTRSERLEKRLRKGKIGDERVGEEGFGKLGRQVTGEDSSEESWSELGNEKGVFLEIGDEIGDDLSGELGSCDGEEKLVGTQFGEENLGKLGAQVTGKSSSSELGNEKGVLLEIGDDSSGELGSFDGGERLVGEGNLGKLGTQVTGEGSSSDSLSELANEKENLEGKDGASEKIKLKDEKYVKMWRLMYKHTVKGLPKSVESPSSLEEKEEDLEQKSEEFDKSYQNDAVKIVQQAFDEILLPEIQQEESVKEAKTPGSEPRVSKSWTSLKKILVLKRFVKAMEKVKRINRGTVRFLPLKTEPEAESVRLRSLTSQERKNAEDWMLDFALQQVVSKLEPAQQRRVAMLVEAFETVLPLPEADSSPRSSVEDRPRVELVPTLGQSGEKMCEEGDEDGNGSYSFVRKALSRGLFSQLSEETKARELENRGDQADFDGKKSNSVETLSKFHEDLGTQKLSRGLFSQFSEETKTGELDFCGDQADFDGEKSKSDEKLSKCREDLDTHALSGGLFGQFSQKTKTRGFAFHSDQADFNGEKPNSNENLSTCHEDLGPQEAKNQLEKPVTSSFEAPKHESEAANFATSEVSEDAQSGKQSYVRLWGYVYKHMMIPSIDEHDTNTKTPSENNTKPSHRPKNDPEDSERAILRRIEAIKLIEKAIDEVILPENNDDEPQAPKIQHEEVKSSPEPACDRSPERKISRNWSNLKKMILLKRFIKALEGAGADSKGFNPRAPRLLAEQGEAEAEKVKLRKQEMDERKRAEEWMVDHALQQAVARLTPARKKKVQLLVEAFETVTPNV